MDLYLGGDIGMWALRSVSSGQVRRVFTPDGEIAEAARGAGIEVFKGDANAEDIPSAEVGLSVHYPVILSPAMIGRYRKIYNLHPAYLPWGRGFYPVFWALWENTPAGATLHEITAGIDEGPIVSQILVESFPWDTGETLHQRVREAEKRLFLEYWPMLAAGRLPGSTPQPPGGTYHRKKEFFDLKQGADWERMSGEELVRLIRAMTFTGHTGLELNLGGKKIEVSLRPMRRDERETEEIP